MFTIKQLAGLCVYRAVCVDRAGVTQSYIALIRFGLTDPFQADLAQALKSDGFDLRSVGGGQLSPLTDFQADCWGHSSKHWTGKQHSSTKNR